MVYQIEDEAHSSMRRSNEMDALYLTFTAEEVGRIALMVVKGVERNEAIRRIPRYTAPQHEAYAAFYDDLCKVITISSAEE